MGYLYLSHSLNNLFREIDARWPKRDRRTDGAYRDPKVGRSVGHNRGNRGLVHAIDVDDDGIDEGWIIRNIYKRQGVLRYIIWNRQIYHERDKFNPRRYTGSNPHTDHMHIEINQTQWAEDYSGHWGIAPGDSGFGPAPGNDENSIVGDIFASAILLAMDEGGRDYRPGLLDMANWNKYGKEQIYHTGRAFKGLRS